MCGIAGIIRIHDPKDGDPPAHLEAIPEAWLDTLDESIKHRGPDGAGRFRDRATRDDGIVVDVALVHRRLSIIDHEGGHQPMVHDGERLRPDLTYQPGEAPIVASEIEPDLPLVAVVFNGCIYNHRELRKELEAKGHVFETDHSDTEVLVQLHRVQSSDEYSNARMMGALAGWHRQYAWLGCQRDSFGEKPLYHTKDNALSTRSLFAFASVPEPLDAITTNVVLDSDPKRDAHELAGWIARGGTDRDTPYRCVMQLEPGGYLDAIGPRVGAKARGKLIESARAIASVASVLSPVPDPSVLVDDIKQNPLRSFRLETRRGVLERFASPVEKAIRDAVALMLRADTQVTTLLSGGIDSAIVTAMAAQELGSSLTAISVRMPDRSFDESVAASEIARIIGVRHEIIDVGNEPAKDLVSLIERSGIPFGDSSLLPTHWAFKAAAGVAPVALTGDGGDEIFVGYDRYMTGLLPLLACPLAWLGLHRLLPGREPRGRFTRVRRLIASSSKLSYDSLNSIFDLSDADRLLDGPSVYFESLQFGLHSPHGLACIDLSDHFPGILLRKVDIASMDIPVEARCPLLDECVVAAAQLKPNVLTFGRKRKALLKAVARRHIPDHIVDRPKQGFAIPIGEWFRTDYGSMRTLLYDHLESAEPFPGLAEAGVNVNMGFVRRMLREHDAAGEKSINPWHGRDHSQRLYMLLVLSIWAKWLKSIS